MPPAPGAGTPHIDLERVVAAVVKGNWIAAGATAAAAYLTALLGATIVLALLAPDLGIWDWLVSIVTLTAAVFTVDVCRPDLLVEIEGMTP